MILLLLQYIIFGFVFPLNKIALNYSQPFFFVGIRMLIGGVFILLYQYFFRKKNFYLYKKHLWLILLLSIFNVYLTNSYELWGLQYITAGKAAFLYNLTPFFSAIFSFFIFNEKITKLKCLGLFLGFIGFIPIIIKQLPSEKIVEAFFIFSWAELALILAALSTALGWICMRKLIKDGYPMLMANGLSMFIGSFFCFINFLLFESWNFSNISTNISPILFYAFLITFIQNILGYNLYGYLLKKYTATLMTFAGYISPFLTALFSWLMLGEKVSIEFFISAFIVFWGLFLFYKEEKRLGYITK